MLGWIDPFYVAAGAALEPGHVWLGRALELPARQALRIDRVNPKDDSRVDFTLSEDLDGAFEHPPVHSLGLGAGQAALLVRAARERPLVVLGGGSDATVMVVPVSPATEYDATHRARIAAYGFPDAFYLPASASPALAEGVARLEQAQPVPRAQLTAHQGLTLSPDALDALVESYVAFATGRRPADSLILEYRREHLA